MTQVTQTEKHSNDWAGKMNRFAIRVKLTPTARELWAWLKEEIDEGRTEIVDLRDFQKLVVKERGKPHDFRVIQTAIGRLVKAGILKSQRQFTNFVHKWTLRPINRLLYPVISKPKISENRSQIPNLATSNGTNAVEGDLTTTTIHILNGLNEADLGHLEESVSLCKEAGICYEPDVAIQVLGGLDAEYVRDALLYTKAHAKSNPEGYLRLCLERGWHEKRNQPISLVEVFELVKKVARGRNG